MRTAFALAALVFAAACTTEGRPKAPPPVAPASPPAAASSPAAMMGESAASNATAPAPGKTQEAAPAADAAPYDLAADRDRRVSAAKSELGEHTQSAIVSDIFVTIGPPGWQGAAFSQSVSLMKNAMAGYMNDRFAKKPVRAISVYLFPNAPTYEAFCKKQYDAPCIAHYGFYSPNDRYMVMNAGLGLGTLTHELVHPLVEADFPGAPTWLNEGIASVFEAPSIPRPGEIHGVKNWRHPRLAKALRSQRERDAAQLSALFGMADASFRDDDEDLHYAQARYACQWLDDQGKLWPFYQRWRDHADDDPTGAKSFEAIVGKTPADANAAWAKWVLAL